MYLIFDKALMIRSSDSIVFFKDDEENEGQWKEYHRLDKMRGQIYFIKGNVRIQVTTDTHIYFFLINKDTFTPKLENVMYNYMNCSQMMFGPRVRYSLTYKTMESEF
jgi:hypothetical protein